MDWLQRGLTQFRTLSIRDKVPVLLCSPAILDLLGPGEFDSIPDQLTLTRQIDLLSKRLGTLWLDKWLAAVSDIVSGIVVTPSGFPGRVTFPIFPFRTANNEILHRIQCVDRDRLDPRSFAKFFGLFRKLPESLRPRVLFMSKDRMESTTFFENIEDLVEVYEAFPSHLARVRVGGTTTTGRDYFGYLASGSFRCTSTQSMEKAEPEQESAEIRQKIIRNYHICMAQQRDSAAFSAVARENIRALLQSIDKCILYGAKHNSNFLIASKIQSLLLKIVIDDDDSESLYQAMALSRAVENLQYEQKCFRFVNQIAGVSSYALDCLKQSAAAIADICEREPYQQVHRLEYFAVMQNTFITRLFNRRSVIDTGEAASCLEFATDQFRYFDELAMLANSIGLSFLATDNYKDATRYFSLASTYSADRLTHLNIRINELISHTLGGDIPSSDDVSRIFDEYLTLPFGDESAYHAAMAFGNLWKLARDKRLQRRIAKAAADRGFIKSQQDGAAIIPDLQSRGFLFMSASSFSGAFGSLMERSGFMPAFHFNWSTPVAEASSR
jgi:hypothetical protein